MNTTIVSLAIKILVIILYVIGMSEDIQTRRFRNWTLLLILVGGGIVAYMEGHLGSSFIAFLLLNLLGLAVCSANILGAADCKVLSSTVFFFDILDSHQLLRFLLILALCIIVFTLFWLLRKNGINKEKWKNHLEMENLYLKELVVFKKFEEQSENDQSVLKASTVPFTVPIGGAMILYLFLTFQGVIV